MNTEDSEFQRIEREATRGIPDAIHHTDTSESLEYITGWNDCRQAMLAEQTAPAAPVQQEPDKHQEYIDSLSHDSEEKMLTQIFHWARQSYSRHQRLVAGQAISAADSSDSHIIWAALRWAKENPSPQAQPAQRTDDTKRLDALTENSWDLRCFDMPTGADDADIGWRVVEHHMAKPNERTVAEVFLGDPRQAIDAAIKAAHNKENT